MNYRLLEVSWFYPKYLEYFYNKNQSIEELDYNTHLKTLLSDCFAESDFIHPELQRLGNESQIIICNDVKLQYKWKKEYENSSLFEILCAQIKEFQPDILYFEGITLFDEKQYKYIRVLLNKKCLFVGWHFTTVDDSIKTICNCFDQIYTGSKYILSLINQYHKNAKLLYHGFHTPLLQIIKETKRENKLVFPGSIFIGEEIHNNRIDMFTHLYQKDIICDFYGNVYGSFIPNSVKQYIKFFLGINKSTKKRIETERILRKNIKPNVFGLDYYNILNKYSICINQHAGIAKTGSGNMRMFEATGMGACLLTDYREENDDLFVPDEEIVVYHNYDELVEKAEYLIKNPNVAEKIAQKGQLRTLNTHTYKQKAEKMNEYIQELLK